MGPRLRHILSDTTEFDHAYWQLPKGLEIDNCIIGGAGTDSLFSGISEKEIAYLGHKHLPV